MRSEPSAAEGRAPPAEEVRPEPVRLPRASPLARAVYVGIVALYVLAFPYHPALHSPNELVRLWAARSIVDFGQLDINEALRSYGPVGDMSFKDGRFYSSKAPLLSFAEVPIYAAIRAMRGGDGHAVPELGLVYVSRLFLTVLPTLLVLVLIRRFLLAYVSPPIADAVTATYALGSLAFSYSLLFMSHQPSAALLFTAFYALWRCARGDWRLRGYLVAGAAAGAAVMAEYTSAVAVVLLAGYGVLSAWAAPRADRRLARIAQGGLLAVAGALPFVAGLMAYHQAAFGGPFESGYKHLADAAYQPWHLGGFLGIHTPIPSAFALSFFSPHRGLFTMAPFLLLAIPGLWAVRRRSSEAPELGPVFWFTAILFLWYAYFTSSFSYESWGWTTGPRHMTGLVPFLLLPVAALLERAKSTAGRSAVALRGIMAGLCAASVFVTGLATLVNYVPDGVTNVLSGFVLPLFGDGFFPPSLIATIFPNPTGGVLLIALVVVEAAAIGALAAGAESSTKTWAAPGVALASAAAVLLLLSIPGGDAPGDLGARHHLESVWLTPNDRTIELWPSATRVPYPRP